MKRILLLVTFSLLLAMWILSAWELTAAANSLPISTELNPSITFRLTHLDDRHRITDRDLFRNRPQLELDGNRLNFDQDEHPAPTTPIFCDPIEMRRLVR